MEEEIQPQIEEDIALESNDPQCKKTKKIISIILVLIILSAGGVFGTLYAKIWNPLWNPFRLEPKAVLSEMALRMKELKTFHVEGSFEAENNNTNVGTDIILDIDRTLPGSSKIKGVIKVPIFLTEIEFVKVGENLYIEPGILSPYLEYYLTEIMGEEAIEETGGFKNRWIKVNKEVAKDMAELFSAETREEIVIDEELSEEKQEKFIQEMIKLFVGKEFYEVKEELPDEKIDNQLFYHYLITLKQDEIKKLALDMTMTALEYSPIEGPWETDEDFILDAGKGVQDAVDEYFKILGDTDFEVWISQKDNYLYRLKFEKENLENGDIESIFIDINFSEFNQPQNIESPEDFIDMEKITEKFAEKMLERKVSSRSKARDARRQSDIRQISLAMEMYYNDNSSYPVTTVTNSLLDKDSYTPNYIDPWPKDPGGGVHNCNDGDGNDSYCAINNSTDQSIYCVYAALEDGDYLPWKMEIILLLVKREPES